MKKVIVALSSMAVMVGSFVLAPPVAAASANNWYVSIQVISNVFTPANYSKRDFLGHCTYNSDYQPGDKVKVTADGRTLGLASLKLKVVVYKESGFDDMWSCVYYANVPVKSNSASFYEVVTGSDAPEDVSRSELIKYKWRLEWGYIERV